MRIYGVQIELDRKGYVAHGYQNGVRVYPYIRDGHGGADQVCDMYKPESFRKAIREGRGFFQS